MLALKMHSILSNVTVSVQYVSLGQAKDTTTIIMGIT